LPSRGIFKAQGNWTNGANESVQKRGIASSKLTWEIMQKLRVTQNKNSAHSKSTIKGIPASDITA
jgi:hypothetical protein